MAADSKTKLLSDAEKFVLQGKIQPAIAEYLKIVEMDPGDVLILNTIGDLYLRQRNIPEANKYFAQVAENYVHNNFFLKAIAVYKKILNADPDNLPINLTMASLYAKQGLGIDARNQYLKVAALLEQDGKAKEVMDVYEKIGELDPSNAAIQRKLAELHLAAGSEEKAHSHFIGAARAQVRAGDLTGGTDSYKHAMRLAPLDVDAMRGFLECCLKKADLRPALEHLKKSVEMAPENLDMREMLGQAYLEGGDPEAAARAFQVVVSMDESRYENYFPVANALIEREAYDQAVTFLDNIIPVLITHRETDRAAKIYEQVLQIQPGHIPSLQRLASIFSATGNHPRYLEVLDQMANYHIENKNPVEALDSLEKILHLNPASEIHKDLHRKAFTQAYPDTPYALPMELQEAERETEPVEVEMEPEAPTDGNSSAIVEVDLLLNYGLRDKALSILQSLEAKDPEDKDVRLRLLSLYKSEKKYIEAAEQCLLLAALSRKANREEAAQNYIAEAKQLDPDADESNLDEIASRHGILPSESTAGAPPVRSAAKADSEVDLSSDLLDIFFKGDQESEPGVDAGAQVLQDAITEGFPQDVAPRPPTKPVEEQLQEVDFYIRLGFNDEALAKLNEIAKISPGNPELALRFQKLGESGPAAASASPATHVPSGQAVEDAFDIVPPEADSFQNLGFGDSLDSFAASPPEAVQNKQPADLKKEPKAAAGTPAGPKPELPKIDFPVNDMFADLMEEVSTQTDTDQEAAKANFEEHFSLGTAYREMELIEEAIKEFETALKSIDLRKGDPKVIQCCGMLSTCFLKKNMPRSALRWCQTGLDLADVSSHEAMALRYDMGIAHSMEGSNERALECFDRIFSIDPGYRDVAQRIDTLRSGFERHAPSP